MSERQFTPCQTIMTAWKVPHVKLMFSSSSAVSYEIYRCVRYHQKKKMCKLGFQAGKKYDDVRSEFGAGETSAKNEGVCSPEIKKSWVPLTKRLKSVNEFKKKTRKSSKTSKRASHFNSIV